MKAITIPGKIPIRIYPVFWVLVLLISVMQAGSPFNLTYFFSWAIVIFTSVLIHEMGHALTSMAFGQKVQIDLVAFGGLTHHRGKPLKKWQDFLVVLNGPLSSALICLVTYFLLTRSVDYSPFIHYLLQVFLVANAFWTLLNLIPVQPLDGGQLLKIVLEGIFGLRGVKIALFISMALAIAAGIFFFAQSNLLGGAIFMMLTYENYQSWKNSLNMKKADENPVLQKLLKEAHIDCVKGDTEGEIEKLKAIRSLASEGVVYTQATLLLANIMSMQGNISEAFSILNPLRKKLASDGLRLLQSLAYHSKQWDEAISIGTQAYQAEPNYDIAIINALCHAQRKEAQQAVSWLKCAVNDGYPSLTEALALPEFDPIRTDPIVQRHLKER